MTVDRNYGLEEYSPAVSGENVTASDSADIRTDRFTRGISFGTVEALAVVWADGTEQTIPSGALVAGVMHPMRVSRIKATGTTAADIVAYF